MGRGEEGGNKKVNGQKTVSERWIQKIDQVRWVEQVGALDETCRGQNRTSEFSID